jgi:hypothetical protein
MASTVGAGTGATVRPASSEYASDESSGYGWVIFAGVMVGIVGTLNFVYGIAAISNSKFYARDVTYVITGLNTWGWFLLVLGVLQLGASLGIMAQVKGVRWFGVLCAAGNMLIAMAFVSASPFLAVTLLAIDVLVIYGLIVHGRRLA